MASRVRSFGPMDDWHYCSYHLHKFLKGWGHNRVAEARKLKLDLLGCPPWLDSNIITSTMLICSFILMHSQTGNGRRWQCAIDSLLIEDVRDSGPSLTIDHAHNFFCFLAGS